MVRVSSLGFRLLCANQGADIVFTEEMVSAKLSKATREVVTYRVPRALLPRAKASSVDMVKAANEYSFDLLGGDQSLSSRAQAVDESMALVDVRIAEYVVYDAFKNMRKRQVVFATPIRGQDALTGGDDYPEGCPVIAQLGAADPCIAAAAASVVCEDVDGIDVNMGCPKKFSIDNGMGAALMSKPERAGEILKAIHEAINSTERLAQRPGHQRVPISFKTRVFDDVDASVEQLRRVVESSGYCVHAVTLHARTRDQRSETAPLQSHAEAIVHKCRELHPATFPRGLTFVYNGSVDHREGARLFADQCPPGSPFDAAMLSRAAMWDPSVFAADRHQRPAFVSDESTPESISYVYKAVMLMHRAYHTNFTFVKYHMTRSFQEFPSVKKSVHPKMQAARTFGAFAELVGFDREVSARQFGDVTFEELLPLPSRRAREDAPEGMDEAPPAAKEARLEVGPAAPH